jgi:GntR family transcriptional regulator
LSAAHLDERLPTPLYHQIYLLLRDRLRTGVISPGDTLPGEQELARMLNVSRITVKRALNELASDKLVTRHRGRGTIAIGTGAVPVVKGSFDTLIESLHLMGLETEVEVLDITDMVADSQVAEFLNLEPGAKVQRATRRRKLQGAPFSHLVTYVPAEIASRYSRKDMASTSLLVLLERAGAAAFEAEQWITAVAADPQVASALDIAPSSPLLKIERIMRDANGQPVQLIHAHYRSDKFQYHVKSHRKRLTGGGNSWRDVS